MMRDLILLALVFAAAVTLYRFRARIFLALRRFDARNASRRYEELRDRRDRFAHYKHTVRMAEEEVEEVTLVTVPDERTGLPVKRYLFLGEQFASRHDAEMARRAAVMAKARDFYLDLDNLYLGRQPARRAPESTLPKPTHHSETRH
ncbi:MAG: hypothetical protein ACT4OG_02930 [Alphaproteobacteria bacterium]